MSLVLLEHGPRGRAGEASRWLAAGAIVLAVHVAFIGYLRSRPDVAAPAEEAAVMVELAPVPVAPEDVPMEAPPAPDMIEAPEPVPQEVKTEPVERAELPPPEPISEPLAPEPVAQLPPEPVPEVAPAPVEDIEVPLPPPLALAAELTPPELPPPPPPPRPAVQRIEAKPPPKPEVRPKPVQPPKPRPKQDASQRPPAPRTRVSSSVAANPSDRVAAPSAGAASSRSVSPADWRSRLMAHLNRHKRYPAGAGSTQGQPRVAFTINRTGQVTAARIAASSGSALLDAEAVAMVRRASPVPPPPEGVGGASLSFVVPVRFNVR
ncbi:energy transducer TonB family protein [Ancylobacter terrae]|uniref:energy transducer TonB family protein n=1 Tax=Ancylobacter sp. sgz301288 TaxID=3342077 RepID=UPI003859022E